MNKEDAWQVLCRYPYRRRQVAVNGQPISCLVGNRLHGGEGQLFQFMFVAQE